MVHSLHEKILDPPMIVIVDCQGRDSLFVVKSNGCKVDLFVWWYFLYQLWALLHFIMPTLFDSHEEFNEWFSRDIENHAENKSAIDQGISVNAVFFLYRNKQVFDRGSGYWGTLYNSDRQGQSLLLGLDVLVIFSG